MRPDGPCGTIGTYSWQAIGLTRVTVRASSVPSERSESRGICPRYQGRPRFAHGKPSFFQARLSLSVKVSESNVLSGAPEGSEVEGHACARARSWEAIFSRSRASPGPPGCFDIPHRHKAFGASRQLALSGVEGPTRAARVVTRPPPKPAEIGVVLSLWAEPI